MRVGARSEARGQGDRGVGEVITELGRAGAGEQAGHRGQGVGGGGGGRGPTLLRTLTRSVTCDWSIMGQILSRVWLIKTHHFEWPLPRLQSLAASA